MFQRILVPLDGSLRAERALPIAAHIARASQGMLVLLRVVSAVAEHGPDTPSQPPFVRTMIQTQMEEAQQYLTAIASSQEFTGISLTVAALSGSVVSTIQTAMHTYQVDLLVLCAQRDPREQSQLIGGLAGQLIEHIGTPLLLIPEHGPRALTARTDPSHPITVLVAFDGLRPAHYLVDAATSLLTVLAGQGQGHLHFVPIRSSDFQSEVPVFSKQAINRPVSPVGSETSQAKTTAVLLKERVIDAKQEKAGQRNDSDLLVLEIPAKPKREEWVSEKNQQPFLSRRNIPLFLIPSLGMGQQ